MFFGFFGRGAGINITGLAMHSEDPIDRRFTDRETLRRRLGRRFRSAAVLDDHEAGSASAACWSKKTKGPTFLRFVAPIVETLRELGNSGTASEVADRVLDRLKVSEREQEETTSNGHSRVRNQIGWARFYLAKAAYLDASQRGVWSLTEIGRTAKLDADAVQTMFRDVRKKFPRKVTEPDGATSSVEEEEDEDAETAEESTRTWSRPASTCRFCGGGGAGRCGGPATSGTADGG